MSIIITNQNNLIAKEGWDFPIEELDYLLEEHDGETFALVNNRLFECESKSSNRKTIIIHDEDEKGYILSTISVETDLDGDTIQKIFDLAKRAAYRDTGGEWQTADVIERLPKEWNVRIVNDVEVWI